MSTAITVSIASAFFLVVAGLATARPYTIWHAQVKEVLAAVCAPPQSSSPPVHGEGSPGSSGEECAAVAYAEDIGRCRTGPLANSGQKLTSSRQNRRRGNHRRSHRPVLDFPRLRGTANVGGAVGAGPRKDGSPTLR